AGADEGGANGRRHHGALRRAAPGRHGYPTRGNRRAARGGAAAVAGRAVGGEAIAQPAAWIDHRRACGGLLMAGRAPGPAGRGEHHGDRRILDRSSQPAPLPFSYPGDPPGRLDPSGGAHRGSRRLPRSLGGRGGTRCCRRRGGGDSTRTAHAAVLSFLRHTPGPPRRTEILSRVRGCFDGRAGLRAVWFGGAAWRPVLRPMRRAAAGRANASTIALTLPLRAW